MVVGAVPIGAVLGAAFAGRLSDAYGRRLLIIISSIVFVVGSLICAAAPDTGVLVIARVILGVAIGLASATAPVYISEVAPPDIRGRLVTFFQLAVTIGIVVAYLVGLAFDSSEEWRWMLGLGAVPAFFLFARDAADAAKPALARDGRARLRGPGRARAHTLPAIRTRSSRRSSTSRVR